MDNLESTPVESTEVTRAASNCRDKGDIYHSISEGLYLDVFSTDRLSVERTHGVITFKF